MAIGLQFGNETGEHHLEVAVGLRPAVEAGVALAGTLTELNIGQSLG